MFLTRLLTSGEEDIDDVSVLKEVTSSTACQLMIILSISVTVSVTCLTFASLMLANTFLFILQGSALANLVCGDRFYGRPTRGRSSFLSTTVK